VRENRLPDVAAESRTPTDEEIENLVAIPIYLQDRFSGVVVCANREGGFDDYDEDVLLSLGDHAGAVLQNARLRGELRGSYLATVSVLADAMEAKDPFLRSHSEEVSSYVAAVADRLGLDHRRREELIFGSLLHDIGKIGISERILLKPVELTPEERRIIELHSRIGYQLAQQVPTLRPIAPAILYHHEHFDGSGYPSGLRGEEIPLEARIICVADAFSAMTSDRTYRERISAEEACVELERNAGTQFDPEIVRIFVEEVRRRPLRMEASSGSDALEDPELGVWRDGNEPVLGYGTLAIVDNLTMLHTHRHFHEIAAAEAQRATVQGRGFAVILVELSEIDTLNRQEGYAAGDSAIQAVARAVQQAAARCGGIAFRYGGRRLGITAPDADELIAERLAAELKADLSKSQVVRTAVAAWEPGDTGDDVIDRAYVRLKALASHGE
jgi:diguanylate cyclase (GGDEF)-like protein